MVLTKQSHRFLGGSRKQTFLSWTMNSLQNGLGSMVLAKQNHFSWKNTENQLLLSWTMNCLQIVCICFFGIGSAWLPFMTTSKQKTNWLYFFYMTWLHLAKTFFSEQICFLNENASHKVILNGRSPGSENFKLSSKHIYCITCIEKAEAQNYMILEQTQTHLLKDLYAEIGSPGLPHSPDKLTSVE